MIKRIGFVIVALCCWHSVRIAAQTESGTQTARRLFKQGVQLFNVQNPTPHSDSLAIQNFSRVIALLPAQPANAEILFKSCLNAGILSQTYDRQTRALQYYQKAIAVGNRFKLADSLLFRPYLYAGTAHYYLYEIDSATYYFKKAEGIYQRYPQITDNQRLYNSFGALYFEAGDFRQSINYFQKAIQLLRSRPIFQNDAYTRYALNIATARRRLGQYDSAIALYQKLLPLNVDRSQVLISLGNTYSEKNQPNHALNQLLRVKEVSGRQAILYANVIAKAYMQRGQLDEAVRHLQNAIDGFSKQPEAQKNTDVGITNKLLGDIATQRKQYLPALKWYQRSIVQLHYSFNQLAIDRNPQRFSEGSNYFLLFESLAAKAMCLEQLLKQKNSPKNLAVTLDTYRSVLNLTMHIQKTLDTEESRLFMVQKAFPVHQRAVSLLISVYEQTKDERYLEEAFRRSEQSKAAVLYIGRKENESKATTGIPDSLLRQERNLRFSLSQLFVQIDQTTEPKKLAQIQTAIRDRELALSRLTDRLHDFPEYYRKKFGADTIDLNFLRRKVLSPRTALLSYFQTERITFAFLLTRKGLIYRAIPTDTVFRQTMTRFVASLRMVVPGAGYQGGPTAQYLYRRLIKPFSEELDEYTSLVIVPHNDLAQLSFETLEDDQQQYLVEQFDVTYQYSVSFLRPENNLTLRTEGILSVAPFINPIAGNLFGQLPASEQEIKDLGGTKLTDTSATKLNFLQKAQQASVIHLATHAIANDQEPSRSFIAFFPQRNREDKLYAHELQYGFLAQAQLIFLSACETASGQLVRGEGMMSLSRAFSYAGCSNLITSLWKAEDYATAYISSQFYEHLRRGHSVARSLQLAKIDLLQNARYAQFHSPQYWSHLVFIGSPAEVSDSFTIWEWLVVGVLSIITGWLIWLYTQKKSL